MNIKDLVRSLKSLPVGPVTTAGLTAAATAITSQLVPLGLFTSRLSAEERRALGSKTPGHTELVVEDVARGMVADPAAYPDVPFTGAKLQAVFDEAQAARRLWAILSFFAELAHDHHLALLAECGGAARRAVRIVQAAPGEDPDLFARRLGGLGVAPLRLAVRHKRAWRTRHSKAKARAKLATPTEPARR